MKNSLVSEDEKNRILNLHEFYRKNMVGTKLINEEEKIVTNTDDDWDYKESDNKYYARRKGTDKWLLATGNAEKSIRELIFNKKTPSKSTEDKILLKSPFEDEKQGNLFRKYVNKYYPNIAEKNDLDLTGPYNNQTIINVASKKIESKKYGEITLSDMFFKQLGEYKLKKSQYGKVLPSLKETGFTINNKKWEDNKGYNVDKCTQDGCAEFTYDMIGQTFGDAWHAYSYFDKYVDVSPELLQKITDTFNNINKIGMPSLNSKSPNDAKAKEIIQSLIPSNQKSFNNLPLGSVVGLYYPDSSNFDLAFYQSAIGKSRDNSGNLISINKPFFCKKEDECNKTLWQPNDEKKKINFKPSEKLSSGKSFVPNTHLGFIGYIDGNGERYVVHNIHNTVYAFPVSKMNKNTLSIIWAGTPKVS